jgi:diguanylate cyclase
MEHYLATGARAQDIFNQVLSALSRYKITPTPINYMVWYEYYLNENEALIEEVNKALADGGKWHDILGFRLYHSLIKQQCTDMHEFEEDLTNAHSNLNTALQGLGENINTHTLMIVQGATPEKLAALQESNSRLALYHKNTQTLIQTISQKAEKTITFNFRDPITKLYNEKKLIQEVDKLKHLENLPPFVMLDMDNFLGIQRDYGVVVAENIVRFIARSITKIAGKQHSYRTGDNEFVIFTSQNEQQLLDIAEQVRHSVAHAQLKRKDTGLTIGNFSITGVLFYLEKNDLNSSLSHARTQLRIFKSREQRNKIHEL